MQSKGNQPNAVQKRWRESVRSLGSVISGGPAVIHHAVGATAKHNKIPIGHWWLIPLTDEEHKALHLDGETFNHESRKVFEKWAFMQVVERLEKIERETETIYTLPDLIIQEAIMDFHR